MTAVRPPLVSVLVATALTLILVGRAGGPLAGPEGAARSAARAVFIPVEAAGASLARPFEGAAAALGRGGDLARTEAALARERQRARSEAARGDALEAENGRLAALLGLDGPSRGDGVAARIVAIGAGRGGGTLVLDRGADIALVLSGPA